MSLCDGISCGNMALEKLGIQVNKYYASEIKPIAIKTTLENFPSVIQVGDVNKISYKDGTLYTEAGNFKVDFDLVMFGSPCQSFSRAMRKERRTGLEDKEKSGLFLECYRILKEIKPKYFLMENVVMNKGDELVITELMGVEALKINSSIITAQMRERLYWTNIPTKEELEPKEIKVNDILTSGFYPFEKARCLMKNDSHGYYNGCNWTPSKRFYRWYYKSFSTMVFPNQSDFIKCRTEFERIVNGQKASASLFDTYQGDIFNNARYLWKEERARLQTIPEKYIKNLSEKDASDLIGDAWTVDVIAFLLSGIKERG